MHRVYLESDFPTAPTRVEIKGDEAAHALRVRRLRSGEAVELLDGRGGVASAILEPTPEGTGRTRTPMMWVRVIRVERRAPVRPRVVVLSAAPKGSRIDELIEGLSQVGVAEWRPLHTSRAVVDPREGKLARLGRIAVESMKQCGRAWVLSIGEAVAFEDAIRGASDLPTRRIIADGGAPVWNGTHPESPDDVAVLIGPEGGFTPEEVASATASGATAARFGPHTMRIETAAVATGAILLSRAAPESV